MTARPQGAPRKIKRNVQENSDPQSQNTLKYQFYRNIIHPTILKLKNEIDKLNYSTWLSRLDLEDEDNKLLLIKILFVSLKNRVTLHIFENCPPEDLSELNLDLENNNAMEVLKYLQDDTYFLLAKKIVPQETRFKRSAAVATDMRSYTSVKTSPSMVQSYYAKSDFPIRLWDNPSTIVLPISNIDHNQWDLYMNHFNIQSQKKDTDDNKHQNDCKSLKVDQVSKVVTTAFRWHPNSLLLNDDRPKRSACILEADQEISNQPLTQELIDNAAFDIVYEKSFPGHKMLDPRIYSSLLTPDPKYVFTMTNVKIIFNNISHIAYINYKQKSQCKKRNVKVPETCCPQQNSSSKDNCSKIDDSKTICILPFTKTYPCPEIAVHNSKHFQNTSNSNSITRPRMNTARTRDDSECIQSNEAHSPCDKTFASSRSENKSLECEEKQNVSKCEQNMSLKKEPNNSLCCSSQNHTRSEKLYNSNSNCQSCAHTSQTSYACNITLDDSSNYDWTMSSIESSNNQNVASDWNCTPNDFNRSRLDRSQNAGNINCDSINETPKRHNRRACSSNSGRRNIFTPCSLSLLNQEERPCHVNQNNSCPTCPKHQQNNYLNTPVANNNRRSLSAMKGNCSNRNETMTRPRNDENFDPDISSYSRFSNINNHFGDRNGQMRLRSSSCHNLPTNNINNQSIDSDEGSDCSDWSDEIDFRPLQPTNYNNSGSLTTLTSWSSNSSDDCERDKMIGSMVLLPARNNNSNIGICDYETNNIQNISMPHNMDDFEESDLISLPRDNFQDLENMTMPNNSYVTLDSNNTSTNDFSDIRNTSMPNNSWEELSNNNNKNNC